MQKIKLKKINDEVFYVADGIVIVDASVIRELKQLADENPRKRVRLCAHGSTEDVLHEMIIVLGKENYIRPHRHPNKSESFHVIEGSADVLIFEETGDPITCLKLGDYASGQLHYFRINQTPFHSVVVQSDYFVFHETTNGSFNRHDTEFAAWAPHEDDVREGCLFLSQALERLEQSRDS